MGWSIKIWGYRTKQLTETEQNFCWNGFPNWDWRLKVTAPCPRSNGSRNTTLVVPMCYGLLTHQIGTQSNIYGIFLNNAWGSVFHLHELSKCDLSDFLVEEWCHIPPAKWQTFIDSYVMTHAESTRHKPLLNKCILLLIPHMRPLLSEIHT